MHTHHWIVEAIINIPEDPAYRTEVHEVCVAGGECDWDNERIRIVPSDSVVVINPN